MSTDSIGLKLQLGMISWDDYKEKLCETYKKARQESKACRRAKETHTEEV